MMMSLWEVLMPLAEGEGDSPGGWLAHIGIPTGIASAIAVVVVTLIKARSTDRRQLSRDQERYISRVTRERNQAVAEQERLQEQLDAEREARRIAEDASAEARRSVAALQEQIEHLTGEITELRAEVSRLNEQFKHSGDAPDPS